MAITQTLEVILKANNQTAQAFGQLNKSLESLKKAALSVAAVLLTKEAIEDVINTTSRLGQEIDTLRDNLGISAEEASRLNYAARVVGSSAEEVSTAFGALNRKLIDQAPLLRQGKDDFSKWGVSVLNAQGEIKSFPEVLNAVRQRLRELPAGLERSGAAMDLMGRNGRQLLDLMTLTDAQFKEMAQDAESMGLVLSDAGVDSLEEFQRNLNRMDLEFDALKLQLGQFLMPILRALFQWFRENSGAIKAFGEALRNVWGIAKPFIDALGQVWDKLKGFLDTVRNAIAEGGPLGLLRLAWDTLVGALKEGRLEQIPIVGDIIRIVKGAISWIDDGKGGGIVGIWNKLTEALGSFVVPQPIADLVTTFQNFYTELKNIIALWPGNTPGPSNGSGIVPKFELPTLPGYTRGSDRSGRPIQFNPTTGDIRMYAGGTDYVPRTGLAMLHQGEAVIPANRNTGWGGAITINVSGNIAASERELAERIAAQVGNVLVRATLANRNLAY